MANLQEFMSLLLNPHAVEGRACLYGASVTPRNGVAVYTTVRSTLGLGRVRLEVQRKAIDKFGSGFTFSVRPL